MEAVGGAVALQRGANSPLPHCGAYALAYTAGDTGQRGANSPLPHCGASAKLPKAIPGGSNEGRIRPSLIAAGHQRFVSFPGWLQRGANSPLPHCGNVNLFSLVTGNPTTRGEFAPPSLRPQPGRSGLRPDWQRGANSPLPHCGRSVVSSSAMWSGTTRGEFAPPSLRRVLQGRRGHSRRCNEGRIRPSLIAALSAAPPPPNPPPNEGRIRPSLIAAWTEYCYQAKPRTTRGEFAPPSLRRLFNGLRFPVRRPTRGEFAPPSLRRAPRRRVWGCPPPTRGEFAPPSLRPGLPVPDGLPFQQRGANSPLPHCGRNIKPDTAWMTASTRGEFAPPSLRRLFIYGIGTRWGNNEGRIRPSLIAAG